MLNFPLNGNATVKNGDQTIRFGGFEADLLLGEVRKAGSRIKLQDQPFKVLEILLEHPGELVTREELQARIWPEESYGNFDHAVNVAVGKLRAALGDSAENPMFIETVPRRGYRFVACIEKDLADTNPQRPAADLVRPNTTVSVFRRMIPVLLAILVSGFLVGLGVLLGHRTAKGQPPDFQRLTFSRGTVYSARFAPDGHNVIYAASWNGGPTELFSSDPKMPGERSLGFPATQLLAVSTAGEMAVLQSVDDPSLFAARGTLGQIPLTGGSPRLLAEDVEWADWSSDGATLAAVRNVSGNQRLEFPLGHVLYETAGWISHPRISPKGNQVAFLDHQIYPDDKGSVSIVDLEGHKKVLSAAWGSVRGLAWSADGTEI
jgi:DNA-binding winged helix-turn-helix (wHTH) protein